MKINNMVYEVDVDNEKPMADIAIEVEKGEADCRIMFRLVPFQI